MTKKAFDKIAAGLEEALAVAQGDDGDAKLHVPSSRYTPAQAADRIRELRKGHALPEGETIRSVIEADKL